MKRLIFLFLIVLFFSGCGIFSDILKDASNEVKDVVPDINFTPEVDEIYSDLVDEAGHRIDQQIDKTLNDAKAKIIDSYEVTDFHYAISFGDNSSLYETQENSNKLGSFSYYLLDADVPPVVKARNYNSAGEILFVTGHYERAEKSLFKSYEIYKGQNMLNEPEAVLNMTNLGLLYQTIGKYTLAEQFSKDALSKFKHINGDTVGYAATLNNLGVLYKIEGKYTDAEKYLIDARDYIADNSGENNIEYAIVTNNLAMLYQLVNKTDKAENLMLKSLSIAKNHTKEKSSTYVRLKVNLALLYQAEGKYLQAEKIYLEAIELKKKRLGTKHPDYATLLRNLAALYMDMQKYSEVEPLLTEARDIYRDKFSTDNPQYAKTIYELARYYQAIGNFDQAEGLFIDALETQKKLLDEHNPDIAQTQEYLAINYWQKNQPSEALEAYKQALDQYIYQINTYFEAMSEAEKTQFWNKIHPKFIRFYNFAAQFHSQIPEIATVVYNYHIQTKALLLNSSRKIKNRILNSNNQELIAKYTEWQDIKNYTAKLFSLTNEELEDRNINLDSLIDRTDQLEKEISTMSADFKTANENKIIDLTTIENKLESNEAAIEVIRVDKYKYQIKTDSCFYIAVIAKKNSKNPDFVVFHEGNKMEDVYIKQYHKAITTGKDMDKFYEYFWQSIDEKLLNEQKLFVSLDGIYNQLNINTFKKPNGNYIIDEKMIYNLTNTRDVVGIKEAITGKTSVYAKDAVVFGFPDYLLDLPKSYSTVPPLPGTKTEVENIISILKSKNWKVASFLGKEANEANLKSLDNPYVLHIATHGYFIETGGIADENSRSFGVEPQRALNNPLLRSGLLFAGADKTILNLDDDDNTEKDDGILNAFEAIVLKLDKTQLVILSACQTGLGEIKTGEGVYGLQRAFQIAGAKTIITSLWKVSDEGTQDLMSAFYKKWLKTGDEYQAFREAQLYIKEKYKYPYYWGAFVLVGK